MRFFCLALNSWGAYILRNKINNLIIFKVYLNYNSKGENLNYYLKINKLFYQLLSMENMEYE